MSQPELAVVTAPDSGLGAQIAQFVTELTTELGRDTIVLHGYPEVAMRVQRALNDDNVSAAMIVRLIGSEPVLAGRVLSMANAAALTTSSGVVTELRTAVARMGVDALRSAVMSYALNQLRSSRELAAVALPMRELWESSVVVAALCSVVARRLEGGNPDSALLTGVMHGIGKLYIVIKARKFPLILANSGARAEINADWHVTICRALMKQWQMPEIIAAAVGHYEGFCQSAPQAGMNLTGVLFLSTVLANNLQDPERLAALMATDQRLARFGLSAADCQTLLAESKQQIAQVMESLGM
jgi:HD-like signal output (HDOD) protein